ncbi:MAG: acyl-CoA dehydrogenase [Acidiferrobacterales bacterium]
MAGLVALVLMAAGAWALAYLKAPLWLWSAALIAVSALLGLVFDAPREVLVGAGAALVLILAPLNIRLLRRALISNRLLAIFRNLMPKMSDTEREAMQAGTVWWDAELFSGAPNWRALLDLPPPHVSAEEQAFLDGPVEELCRIVDDWQITHELHDLPPEIWRFVRENGFLGLIIPKRYGGMGFSALAHSAVVMKLASRSIAVATTVMVPNSLGPAELLLHYGTDEQKDHYLPRLARGEEIPCFALTSAEAGSDAAAMPDTGIVCRQRDVLGIRLNWRKRYITLGPVATVLGLAFKLHDPDQLLGDQVELGITAALIPTDTPGVTIGRRHDPLGVPFQNGPNSGKDVFIPIDWVIGGREGVGQGWRMLMERLAAGRGISLPALGTSGGKVASRVTGAYARIRRQFKLPIGRFEGIEEALARIAGNTYMMDAARTLTAQAVDLGEKPSVVSAIVKYHLTEHMRHVINDAMDIHGGAGICLGPRNVLGRAYQGLPIPITVEGANIMTRSLIIYGQGAIRCHPYVYKEMEAIADTNQRRASKQFDQAFFGHAGYIISNAARALLLGLTGARITRVVLSGPTRRYYQHLTRMSAAFAFTSDVAMVLLGGALKRKEKLSGRLADALSYMYLASAALKRFEDQGRPKADLPVVKWVCEDALYRIQQALDGVIRNFPARRVAWVLRRFVFPLGRRFRVPSDRLGHQVASILLAPSAARDRLTEGMYLPQDPADPVGRLEDALPKVIAAEPLERKLYRALENSALETRDHESLIGTALRLGVIDDAGAGKLRAALAARAQVIEVDDFPANTTLVGSSKRTEAASL